MAANAIDLALWYHARHCGYLYTGLLDSRNGRLYDTKCIIKVLKSNRIFAFLILEKHHKILYYSVSQNFIFETQNIEFLKLKFCMLLVCQKAIRNLERILKASGNYIQMSLR